MLSNLSELDKLSIEIILELFGYEADLVLAEVLALVQERLNEGSLFLPVEELGFEAKKALTSKRWANILGELLILDDEKLYFQKYYVYEKNVKESLASFVKKAGNINSALALGDGLVLDDDLALDDGLVLDDDLALDENLSEEQALAVKLSLKKPFCVITGGPGTGKTFTMVAIVKAFLSLNYLPEEIALVAPTGRASLRMQESLKKVLDLDIYYSTIHRLLAYNPGDDSFLYGANNYLPYRLVIVDEVSMVDIELMHNLLLAIDQKQTRLIFLGDKDQLPSVSAGAVLSSILAPINASLYRQNTINLNKSFRAGGEVFQVAKAVNEENLSSVSLEELNLEQFVKALGNEPIKALDNKPPVKVLDNEPIKALDNKRPIKERVFYLKANFEKLLIAYVNSWYKESVINTLSNLRFKEENTLAIIDLIKQLENYVILCLVKDGVFGTAQINELLVNYLKKLLNVSNDQYFHGQLILITKNNYQKQLYNGDIGLILLDEDHDFRVVFRRGDSELKVVYLKELAAFELGYAITVHKSQGSEYKNVFLVAPFQLKDSKLLTREIIYTGITRAKNAVFIYGDQKVLELASKRRVERLVSKVSFEKSSSEKV